MGYFKRLMMEIEESVEYKIEQIRGYGNTTMWEDEFLESIKRKNVNQLTEKQLEKLNDILEQCDERAYVSHMCGKDD